MYGGAPYSVLPYGAASGEPLSVATQPQDVTVDVLDDAVFTVAATGGSGSYTYQWYDASDDSALPGETSDTLTLTTAIADDGNTYYVIVDDGTGTVQSNTVTLTVNYITLTAIAQPTDVTAEEGDSASFYFSAGGGYPQITYQWYEVVGGALPGETSPILSLANLTVANDDGSQFYAIATDSLGQTLQSNTVGLTVTTQVIPAVIDVRILGDDGVWYSIMGPAGADGAAGDLIDDSGPKVNKTYSSANIAHLLAGKADKASIPPPCVLAVDGGAPDAVHFVTADGGEPSSTYSILDRIDGGSP